MDEISQLKTSRMTSVRGDIMHTSKLNHCDVPPLLLSTVDGAHGALEADVELRRGLGVVGGQLGRVHAAAVHGQGRHGGRQQNTVVVHHHGRVPQVVVPPLLVFLQELTRAPGLVGAERAPLAPGNDGHAVLLMLLFQLLYQLLFGRVLDQRIALLRLVVVLVRGHSDVAFQMLLQL